MAEEFGLEQRLGDRAAVDGDEGLGRARARPVNGLCEQLLAAAAFAAQQHAGIGGRHHLGLGEQLGHAIGAANDGLAPALVAAGGIDRRGGKRQGLVDLVEQRLAVEGLGQVAEDAACGGVDRIGDRAVRGEQDDRQRRVTGVDLVEQGQAIAAGQLHVAHHQLRPRDSQLRERRFGRLDRGDTVAGRGEPHREQLQQIGVVVHQQQVGHGVALGLFRAPFAARAVARPGAWARRAAWRPVPARCRAAGWPCCARWPSRLRAFR